MKLYEQIEEIIAMAADFHGRLGRFYERLTDEVEKERVAMLLEYLSRHEKRLHEGLRRYAMEEGQKNSETWKQFVIGEEGLSLKGLEPSADMTVDELVEMVMEVNDRLLSFYRETADSASMTPRVREMFLQLAEQQEHEKEKLVQSAEQIKKI
ncbi:MAG: hypothetical protein ACOWYE_03185 [Desulfatiglandales bacterium]